MCLTQKKSYSIYSIIPFFYPPRYSEHRHPSHRTKTEAIINSSMFQRHPASVHPMTTSLKRISTNQSYQPHMSLHSARETAARATVTENAIKKNIGPKKKIAHRSNRQWPFIVHESDTHSINTEPLRATKFVLTNFNLPIDLCTVADASRRVFCPLLMMSYASVPPTRRHQFVSIITKMRRCPLWRVNWERPCLPVFTVDLLQPSVLF